MKNTVVEPIKNRIRVLTYGTYDLLHHGHVNLINRAKANGEYLIVGLSTDEFNEVKGKEAHQTYETRKAALETMTAVDMVIPENRWNQKLSDVKEHNVDMIVMGDDWSGDPRFEELKSDVAVRFFSRTPNVSTTQIKEELADKASRFKRQEGAI